MGKATQALAGRDRARDARLKAARERRVRLDPEQLGREHRIGEAAVDVKFAWEARTLAEKAVTDAEIVAAAAIERLLADRPAVKDVVQLTDSTRRPYVARLRVTLRSMPAAENSEVKGESRREWGAVHLGRSRTAGSCLRRPHHQPGPGLVISPRADARS